MIRICHEAYCLVGIIRDTIEQGFRHIATTRILGGTFLATEENHDPPCMRYNALLVRNVPHQNITHLLIQPRPPPLPAHILKGF